MPWQHIMMLFLCNYDDAVFRLCNLHEMLAAGLQTEPSEMDMARRALELFYWLVFPEKSSS